MGASPTRQSTGARHHACDLPVIGAVARPQRAILADHHDRAGFGRRRRVQIDALGRNPGRSGLRDTAASEDFRRFQVHLARQEIGVATINAAIAALRFFPT